jgi:uncharacterized protein
MTTFVDTSALYALLDEDDANHAEAATTFRQLAGEDLVTHAYVVVEALALVPRRLGWAAVDRLVRSILPVVGVVGVDAADHHAALSAYLERGAGGPSFVDHASFAVMRSGRIWTAFAFDSDFVAAGFDLAR